MEKHDSLHNKIKEFESKFADNATEEQKQVWKELVCMIEHRKFVQSRRPTILIVTPEIVSLPPNMGNLAHVITTGDGGGLADISGSLVAELDRQGVNVHVVLPEYQTLFEIYSEISHEEYEELKMKMRAGERIHLVSDGMFDGAERVYGDSSMWLDKIELRRATAFMRGILRILPFIKAKNPNLLVHCNDWMTGLIPAAAKSHGIKSLMTFHNIFTQLQWPKGLQNHGIDIEPFWHNLYFRDCPDKYYSYQGNYQNNDVDFMTSGLYAADYINTVSPTFLKEIVEGYFMEHNIIPGSMRDMVKRRYYEGAAAGILNAPSKTADPRIDGYLDQKYWYEPNESQGIADVAEGKRINKQNFQRELGLEQDTNIPLFFWPSRIARPQKGFDLLMGVIESGLLYRYNMQVAVVASGDMGLINWVERLQHSFPGKLSYRPFSRKLNQLGKAAADFLLMPSLYEPCGIPQVEAPRYGTLPVVRRTGGLADTVQHLSLNGLMGNGFVFDDFIPAGLEFGISEAMFYYKKKDDFKKAVIRRIMKESFENFNIEKTAKQYISVYENIFRKDNPRLKVL